MGLLNFFGLRMRELSDEVDEIGLFWRRMVNLRESISGNTWKDDYYAALVYVGGQGKIIVPHHLSREMPGQPVLLVASKEEGIVEVYDEGFLKRVPLAESENFSDEVKETVFGFLNRANQVHEEMYRADMDKINHYFRNKKILDVILKPLGL